VSAGGSVSLQRSLAIRFALTMTAGLLGLGALAYAGVRGVLAEEMDRALRATYALQADALLERGWMPHTASAPPGFLDHVNRLILVRDSGGRPLEANVPLARGLPLDRPSFDAARAGGVAYADGRIEGHGTRALYGPVLRGTATPGAVIEVVALRDSADAASARFLAGALATALAAGLAALGGAWMLARSALAPVAEIAAQAELVGEPAPHQRITVHADVQELRGLVGVLNGMLERLDRYCDWHRNIIRDLSHDLRTPLATLRAGAELALAKDRAPEEYRRVLTQSLEEVDRLTLISDALRLLGRLQSGELAPARVPLDLRDVVAAAVGRARERGGGDAVTYLPPAIPVPARADAALLSCALDQVLDNALRHTPPGTRIEVRLLPQREGPRIVVEDAGEGVPEEVLAHLFEPFYRRDPARGRAGGAGLGLTTVATIVAGHAGRVTAERGTRGGLRVSIELPAPAPRPAADAPATVPGGAAPERPFAAPAPYFTLPPAPR
jgi:signal transduction histidine kinase